jgi:hypothetical protein
VLRRRQGNDGPDTVATIAMLADVYSSYGTGATRQAAALYSELLVG